MLSAKDVFKQINTITSELIQTSLCTAFNFPSLKEYSDKIEEVYINNNASSIFLKNIPYADMFSQLIKEQEYNVKSNLKIIKSKY